MDVNVVRKNVFLYIIGIAKLFVPIKRHTSLGVRTTLFMYQPSFHCIGYSQHFVFVPTNHHFAFGVRITLSL